MWRSRLSSRPVAKLGSHLAVSPALSCVLIVCFGIQPVNGRGRCFVVFGVYIALTWLGHGSLIVKNLKMKLLLNPGTCHMSLGKTHGTTYVSKISQN